MPVHHNASILSLLLHLNVLARRRCRRRSTLSSSTLSRLALDSRVVLRSVLGLAPAHAPGAEQRVNIVVLVHTEVAEARRSREGRLDLRRSGADDGNRGVKGGQVLVLLECVGESREAVVDECWQVCGLE